MLAYKISEEDHQWLFLKEWNSSTADLGETLRVTTVADDSLAKASQ